MSYVRYPQTGGASVTVNTTAVTGGTAGSVLFVSSTGKLSQDNAALFWDEPNKRLGIGTATPQAALQVAGGSISCPGSGLNSERFGSGATAAGQNGIAIGYTASAPNLNCTVMGAGAGPSGADTTGYMVAIGASAQAYSLGVAIGVLASTSDFNSVAIGYVATTGAGGSNVSIGRSATSALGSVAIGADSAASGTNSFALGRSCTVTSKCAVSIGFAVANSDDFTLRFSIGVTTTGVSAPALVLGGVTSTTADIDMFRIITSWADNTHATRKSRATFNAYDTAVRECIRIEASGTESMLGFYGVSATARQLLATGAGASVDDVITVLQNLGLCKQS